MRVIPEIEGILYHHHILTSPYAKHTKKMQFLIKVTCPAKQLASTPERELTLFATLLL